MTAKITFDNGEAKFIPQAVKVDTQNFHEGMIDFYDERDNLLEQISMSEHFTWEFVDEPEKE